MVYYSSVAFSVPKEYWENDLLPKLKNFDEWKFYQDKLESLEKDDLITIRLPDYSGWGSDEFSQTIESSVRGLGNFIRCGADFEDVTSDFSISPKSNPPLDLQWPAIILGNEPYLQQSQRMLIELTSLCLSRGIKASEISGCLKSEANKDIIDNLLKQAQEKTNKKDKHNCSAR